MWEKESLKDAENPFAPYNLTEALRICSFFGKKEVTGEELAFSGRLIGGCMDCLVTLLGTRFDRTKDFIERYREDGFVWFLEACDLNVFATRRAMWQMEEAGWFQNVKGFLIGRPQNGEPMMNLDAHEAVLEVAGRKNVPVIMDVDLGHTNPMMPLVVGSMAKVRTKGNDIEIRMELL
jgi:muramoyltetrapeptide carboxypeptidase LdcA involved in peptidoglycan recycling